jgi:hypothetical protein
VSSGKVLETGWSTPETVRIGERVALRRPLRSIIDVQEVHCLWGRVNVRAVVMREFDCGCGYHLEGKDDQGLIIKVLLHLEAVHPEIEEPTIELAEEMVATRAYDEGIPSTRSPRPSS